MTAPLTADEKRLREAREKLRRCDLESMVEACAGFAALVGAPGVGPRARAGWAEARARLARQRRMRGEPWEEEAAAALEHAEEASRQAPDCADCQRALASALTPFPEHGERRRACAVRAVELEPGEALNWYERWKALGSQLDDGAIRRALELDPELFAALHDLGVALTESGHHEPAVKLLAKALEINPRSAQARYNLSVILQRTGRGEEADFVLREAAVLHPGDALFAASAAEAPRSAYAR